MAAPLPAAPTAFAELASKFRMREVARRSDAPPPSPLRSGSASARGVLTSRPHTTSTPAYTPSQRYLVPPLTLLAIDAVVNGFSKRPSLAGVPPRFMSAIAAKLPLDLDVCITAEHVHDELYWRRAAIEGRGWSKCEIAEHGGSWKQLYLERHLATLIERFGMYPDLPLGYEDEFCRPAIDSTHPRWGTLYAKVPPAGFPERPQRERTGANGVEEMASDLRIIVAPPTGWAHLEALKAAAKRNLAAYSSSFAWAHVDRSAPLLGAALPHGSGGGGGGGGGEGVGASSAAATLPVGGGAPPSAYMLPFAAAAERFNAEEEAAALRRDEELDLVAIHEQLREFVTPEELDKFKKTGKWTHIKKRGKSLLCIRNDELQGLLRAVSACAKYVFNLDIQQLPSHMDLDVLVKRLPNLCSLQVTYGMRHLGMRYERTLFGMRVSDAEALSRALRMTSTLTNLSLPCNMIDDNLLMVIMSGLLENHTITHLDLSHNNISSAGVQLLCKLLSPPCQLVSLNLSDNKADERAAKHLARALRTNDTLCELNLRLNEIGDEGGRTLLEGVRNAPRLATLNLSTNKLGAGTAATLAHMLSSPDSTLTSVDVSGNRLDDSDAQILYHALASNTTLMSIDLRGNPSVQLDGEFAQGIMQATRRNEVRTRMSAELGTPI